MKIPMQLNYNFIESDKDFKQLCQNLMNEKLVGVDLESDSLHSCREKICLIQIGTDMDKKERLAFLIDPFKISDMHPFIRILEDPDIIKVFHGADYDIRSLDRDFQAKVNNLFDTEIACRFLGLKERGLASLLKKYLNIIINKKFQKEDWSQRPLNPEMIAYSAADAAYLPELYYIIKQALEEKGRLDWALEECFFQTKVRYEDNHSFPLFERFKGAGKMDRQSLAVLENLLRMRLLIAQKKDRPLFKIISNKALMDMALAKPLTIEKIKETGGLSSAQIGMYGKLCINAVKEAMTLREEELPVYPVKTGYRKDPKIEKHIKKLKKLRKQHSEELNIEPGFLFNNALIEEIAAKNPESPEELAKLKNIRQWQLELVR